MVAKFTKEPALNCVQVRDYDAQVVICLMRRYRVRPLGSGSSSTVSGTSVLGERSTTSMLMDHIPRCPCVLLVLSLSSTIGLSTCLKSLELDARGGTCGWRSAVFRRELIEIDLARDVVRLNFRAPHRHRVVDVTVTRARTNANVPTKKVARLPLPGSRVLGAQHGKLDADLRTYLARLRFIRPMTTIPSLLRMGAGWRLWRISWLIVW
jgi:hypothetical protein